MKKVFDLNNISKVIASDRDSIIKVPKAQLMDFMGSLIEEAEAHSRDSINRIIPNVVNLLHKLKGAREELTSALVPKEDGPIDKEPVSESATSALPMPSADGGPSKKPRIG